MLTRSTFLLTALLSAASVSAQQLPASSPFPGDWSLFNPALTAVDRQASVSARHQSEWSGFTDAPTTTMINGQFAVNKQPLGLGAFLISDRFLPVRQTTAGATYAYHLGGFAGNRRGRRRFTGRRNRAQLSLGLLTAWQQTSADVGMLIINDGDDQALPLGDGPYSTLVVGVGAHLMSRPGGVDDRSFGYAGLGVRQLLSPVNDLTGSPSTFAGLEQAVHTSFYLGYQHYTGRYLFRPSLWVDMADNGPSATRIDVAMERPDAYFAGLSYNINQTASLRMGTIFAAAGEGDQLRVGALGSFNLGAAVAQRGLSYGAYLAYVFGRP